METKFYEFVNGVTELQLFFSFTQHYTVYISYEENDNEVVLW